MMTIKQALLVLTTASMALGQRPSFAGIRPIGYPEIAMASATPAAEELGNRFGENNSSTTAIPTTTQRLPVEANGDRNLIDRLSKLPIDKQPFWFINWQAIEANRNNPQTYPLRPSHFQPVNLPPVNTEDNTGDLNRFGSDTTASTNRDVDVAAFAANSVPTQRPVSSNSDSDDTLGNTNVNDPTKNSTPLPARNPQDNDLFTSPPVIRNPSSSPGVLVGSGQVVDSFASVPFQLPVARPSSQREQITLAPRLPEPDYIVPGDPDWPYPILDDRTRNSHLVTITRKPSVNTGPVLRNRFRNVEEQRPVFVPLGLRSTDGAIYY